MDWNFVVVGGNVQGIFFGIGVFLCGSLNIVLGQGVGIVQVVLFLFVIVGDDCFLGWYFGGLVDVVNCGLLNIYVGSEEFGGVDYIE